MGNPLAVKIWIILLSNFDFFLFGQVFVKFNRWLVVILLYTFAAGKNIY